MPFIIDSLGQVGWTYTISTPALPVLCLQVLYFSAIASAPYRFIQFLLGIVTDLFSLVLLVICLVLSIQTITARSTQIAISSGLKIPMTVPYAAFVIGFSLMILFCVCSLANRIAKYKAVAFKKEGT